MIDYNNQLRSTRILLENTGTYINCHDEKTCHGGYCTLHNRSDHHMRSFPQIWRGDRGIMERICSHGVGHPDPDEINEDRMHGCDGCCVDWLKDPIPVPYPLKGETND